MATDKILRLTTAPLLEFGSFVKPGHEPPFRAYFLQPGESVAVPIEVPSSPDGSVASLTVVTSGDARPGIDFETDLSDTLHPTASVPAYVMVTALDPARYRRYRTLILGMQIQNGVHTQYDEFRIVLWNKILEPPSVNWSFAHLPTSIAPGSSVTLGITLSRASDEIITVPIVASGTAALSDYTLLDDDGTALSEPYEIQFEVGQTSKYLSVLNDRASAGTVTLGLTLDVPPDDSGHRNLLLFSEGGLDEPNTKNGRFGPTAVPCFPTDYWYGVDNSGRAHVASLIREVIGLTAGDVANPDGSEGVNFYYTNPDAGTRGGLLKTFTADDYNGWSNVTEAPVGDRGQVNVLSVYMAFPDSAEVDPAMASQWFTITLLDRNQQIVHGTADGVNYNIPFGPHQAVFQFDTAAGDETGVPYMPIFREIKGPGSTNTAGHYAYSSVVAGVMGSTVAGGTTANPSHSEVLPRDPLDGNGSQGWYRCFVAYDVADDQDEATFPGPDEDRPQAGDTMQYIVRFSDYDYDGIGFGAESPPNSAGDPAYDQPAIGSFAWGLQFEHVDRPATYTAAGLAAVITDYQATNLEFAAADERIMDVNRPATGTQPVLTLAGV
jgi:hypothetical protein